MERNAAVLSGNAGMFTSTLAIRSPFFLLTVGTTRSVISRARFIRVSVYPSGSTFHTLSVSISVVKSIARRPARLSPQHGSDGLPNEMHTMHLRTDRKTQSSTRDTARPTQASQLRNATVQRQRPPMLPRRPRMESSREYQSQPRNRLA